MQENEIIVEETTQEQEVPVEQEASQEQPQEQPKQESEGDKNWRELRQRADQYQRERDEAYRILQQLENDKRSQMKQVQPNYKDEDDDFNIADDDLVEGKHVKKLFKRLEKKLDSSNEASLEMQLLQKYPDMNDVVSHENVEILNRTYPELAETLAKNPDFKKKAIAAYTAIKSMGIYKEKNYSEDALKMQQNVTKPKSINTVAQQKPTNPLSYANSFSSPMTQEMKDALYREMLEKSRS